MNNKFQTLSDTYCGEMAGNLKKSIFSSAILPALFFLISILSFNPLAAQSSFEVKGVVKHSENQELMPGVNVMIKGTTIGVSTNANGEFTIKAPSSDAILVFSFVGFKTTEVKVSGQTTINVLLVPDVNVLDDIIVVAYGTTKRSNLTGSAVAFKKRGA